MRGKAFAACGVVVEPDLPRNLGRVF